MRYFLGFFLVLCLVSNVWAAETIGEALKAGKVNGEFKLWYQTNDKEPNDLFDKENSFFDAGLRLSYASDSWKGASLKLSFYAVDDLIAYSNFANKSMIRPNADETATWLGEAYINYAYQNTSLKLGRQNFKSPLVNSDAWPIFPNNFQGITLQNKDLPQTNVVLGWFFKERRLKQEDFKDFLGDDGVMFIGLVNKTIPHVAISAYYYKADLNGEYDWQGKAYVGYVDSFYADIKAKFVFPENSLNLSLAAQYLRVDPKESGYDATDAYGVKLGLAYQKKMGLLLAYASVDDGYFNAAKFSDNGIKTPLYTATISGDGDIAGRPDTDSYKISAFVKPIAGLTATLSYGHYDCDNKWDTAVSNDNVATSTELVMKYTGFKDFTIFAAYIHSDHHGVGAWSGANDDALNTFRVWVKYVF
ncbi:OprD family outer membrane porin [Thermodesulfatator atlanticus]